MTAASPAMDDNVAASAEVGASEGVGRRIWRRFRRNGAAMTGLVILVLMVLASVGAPLLGLQNPDTTNPYALGQSPSSQHLLGTDFNGRDTLSRVLYGGRVSFTVCLLVVVMALLVALPMGLLAGYFGGALDYAISRFTDALFAFPSITLALVVTAVFHTRGIVVAAIAIAVTFVPGFVRLLRAQVLAIREETYIEASRSIGVTEGRMLGRHVLPNAITPLIVQIASTFAYALLAEAGLSFIGFGVQTPTPSWGTMLQDAFYSGFPSKTWPIYPPGIALALTVLAINLAADGLRDALGREDYGAKAVSE